MGKLMKFKDLPVGAKYKYVDEQDLGVWVKIHSYPKGIHDDGRGLIVSWYGNNGEQYQDHCCFTDEESGITYNTEVEVIPDAVDIVKKLKSKLEYLAKRRYDNEYSEGYYDAHTDIIKELEKWI